jgi:hypothetical protein
MIVVTTLFVFFPTTRFLLLKTTYALSKLDASVASGFWQAENLSKLDAGLIGPRSHSQSSLSLSLCLISNRPHSYRVPYSNVRVQFNIPTSNSCLISVQSFLELFTSDIRCWQLGVCRCLGWFPEWLPCVFVLRNTSSYRKLSSRGSIGESQNHCCRDYREG